MAAVLLATGPALAQQTITATPIAVEPRGAHAVPDVITVPLNKSRIFDLPTDVRDVLVGNPAVADVVIKTPRLVYVLGRKVGDTNVYFLDRKGRQILRLEIRVDRDLAALNKAFAELLPGERIKATAMNADIVLSGIVRSAKAAEDARLIARRFVKGDENVLNMLRIENDQQVMLRVRIAEMSRTTAKDLGFDTFLNIQMTDAIDFRFDPTNFGVKLFEDVVETAFLGNIVSIAAANLTQFAFAFDALESQGLIKTLAEPNLTVISGENANFTAGGEFPFPSGRDNEGNLTFEFKQFGVVLSFTPVVLSSGMISLKIATEVSELKPLEDVDIPFIDFFLATRRAETTVELPSGGSLVIAGLLQNDILSSVDGFPGLKDIPILGALFRSVSFEKNETELIIAVTVYLVAPVNPRDIALPTDGFAPASDFDLYFLGRLHDVYARPGEAPPSEPLKGPIGYLME
jgi:pilus assembly protein CpaC